MDQNPYHSPAPARRAAEGRSRLIPVAICLIVASVLWIMIALIGLGFFYREITAPDVDNEVRGVFVMSIVYLLVSMLYNLLLISGAFSMVRRGSYVWAVATSCLAMVPLLGPCYVVGIPLGVWAFIVLLQPAVRESFQESRRSAD